MMMSSLFKVHRLKSINKLPFSLPNMSLIANEVRNYKVVYSSKPYIQKNKNDINIPKYVATRDEVDRQLLVQAGIFVKILFGNMKFQRKDLRFLYIAKMLLGLKFARIRISKTCSKLGGRAKYDKLTNKIKTYQKAHDEDFDEAMKEALDTNEMFFYRLYQLTYAGVVGIEANDTDIELKIYRAVKNLYEHKDVEKFYFDMLYEMALYRGWNYNSITDTAIGNIVRSMLPFNVPVEVGHQDVSYIRNILSKVSQTIREAQYYAWRTDNENYRWVYDEEIGRSRTERYRLSSKQIRYRLNKLYRILIGKDGWWSKQRVENLRNEMLPSDEYSPVDTTKLDKNISNEEGLTLPKELDDKLKKEIMEDADRNYRRHFVDHTYAEDGNHGKARLHKFKPNKSIHKAISELRKRNQDSGVVPKNMHRLTTDRKVFQTRKTVAGGSMMIDCSGSMGMSQRDIEEVVELLPASWIAGYVGYRERNSDGYDGDIRIIADNGRTDTYSIGELTVYGNNNIDFEALQLLATKPEPRIWVSDQQVIGVNEQGMISNLTHEKRKEIERFVLLNNIIPIENRDMVIKVAKQLSVKR